MFEYVKNYFFLQISKKYFFSSLQIWKFWYLNFSQICLKYCYSLNLPFEEISLWPELSITPHFRLQGGDTLSVTDKRTKSKQTEILVSNMDDLTITMCLEFIKYWSSYDFLQVFPVSQGSRGILKWSWIRQLKARVSVTFS